MIITGAPVENMDFEDVDYWPELRNIMNWSKTNVHSTLHICWGAQAALYGHTHNPHHDYYDEMHIFNPGSIREGRYGVIDIEENGIMCMHNQVRYE